MFTKIGNFKLFPYHIFLLPVFFVWNIWNSYFALIPFKYWSTAILYFSALSIIIFQAALLILKNKIKAGCWTSCLLIIFFFWGAAHDFLRRLSLPGFIKSYKFLVPVIIISLIFLLIRLKKKDAPYRVNFYFTIVFGLFVAIEALTTAFKLFNKDYQRNDLAYYNKPVEIRMSDSSRKPDIFFIVFDEYGSSVALKKYLNYDNSSLDSLLAKYNFFVAKHSKSNYDLTPLSVASTLNLQYFNFPLEEKRSAPGDLFKYQYSLSKSLLPRLLAERGYTILNYGICNLENSPAPYEPYFNRFIGVALYGSTLWGRMLKEVGWRLPPEILARTFIAKNENQDKNIEINSRNFKSLIKELESQTTTPKFVYAHFMLPHTPYYLNRMGQKRTLTGYDLQVFNDSLYIDQLIYTNTWIDSVAKISSRPFQRPRVVIIEGDHGNRKLEVPLDQIVRERQFMNLSCYFFSDKDYSSLYDSITPVNSFRIVLNKYFQSDLPMLKDSTILLLE